MPRDMPSEAKAEALIMRRRHLKAGRMRSVSDE